MSTDNFLQLSRTSDVNSSSGVVLNVEHPLSWPVIALRRQKGQRMPTFWPRRTACGWKTVSWRKQGALMALGLSSSAQTQKGGGVHKNEPLDLVDLGELLTHKS